jgi:DinB superfamily
MNVLIVKTMLLYNESNALRRKQAMPETADQYRNRMFGHVVGRDPLKLQAAAPKNLERLLKGVSGAKLRKRPAANKWSISEIVCHMADTELVGGFRIRLILGAPGTPITPFDQDDWVLALHYDKGDARKALEQFRVLREANLALLKTLAPEQWKQHGLHAERGPETIATIAKMFAGHDINHIKQIHAILTMRK